MLLRLMLCLGCLFAPLAQAFTLENRHWRVDIDPATLAAHATPAAGPSRVLSTGLGPWPVSELAVAGTTANWQAGDFRLSAALQGRVLDLVIEAAASGAVTWPRLPGSRDGLLLPLKEGHYIRANDQAWHRALADELSPLSATEDLSLPAFGRESGQQVLSWVLATPFDNELTFETQEQGLGLAVTHHFTTLEADKRYHVRVVLAEQDLLAPAKAWRAWAQAQGAFVPLAAKLAAVRDGERLIGAPHLYLWGDDWPKTLQALRGAGLSRAWLGLPHWTSGLAAPDAVVAATQAGYLIAPYDSYDTALPPGNRQPTWLTAQLGADAWRRCGIQRADGRRQPGFGGAGVYTNSACVLPLMQQRVPALLQQAPFNSWFLDVAATGMVFNDYDPAKPTSQRQDAANRLASMAWLAQRLRLPVGSEVGGAVANATAAFAHGMQTSGFGWADADLRKHRQSPYYLGAWWPEQAPAVFFKPAQLKPAHRALYFNPATRLPLFQAAYHDSLITSHHWTLDTLKFPQARATSELLAQLYNVAPLLNLSTASQAQRIPYLLQLEGFFRPVHMRLHTQALVGFRWLDALGQVQETTFADGTRLVANFTEQQLPGGQPGQSVMAYLAEGEPLVFRSPRFGEQP